MLLKDDNGIYRCRPFFFPKRHAGSDWTYLDYRYD